MSEADQISIRILELAVSKGTLTRDQLGTLIQEGGDVCDLAVAQDLIGAGQVELLRPLAESKTYLPDYEILDLIGEGSSGAVYRARQSKLGREVALKLLKPSAIDDSNASARSQIEAQVGGSLQHPNIVTVHDYGVHRQRVYLALELVEGDSVLDVIERDGLIESTTALNIARQVASALDYANSKSVVHRDIKPANLLLAAATPGIEPTSTEKTVKVADFGLAFRTGGEEATRLTAAGATLGTPSYVAPEQLQDTNVDQRADIYALGASLFHMVTGKQPFAGGNAFKAIAAKMQGSEEWRNEIDESVPEPIRRLIVDMTHHSPDDRISDYQAVAVRIDSILSNEAGPAPVSVPVRSRTSRWMRWWPAAVAVLGLVVAGTWLTGPNNDSGSNENPQTPAQLRLRTEQTSQPEALFDRRKGVPFPRIRTSIGSIWDCKEDSVGGVTILSGRNGWKTFPIDPVAQNPDFFTITVTANPLKDATTDICFASNSAGDCAIVRIKEGTAQLGMGNIEGSSFEPVPDLATAMLFPEKGDEPTYQIVSMERQSGGWFINVNGEQLGALPANDGDYDKFYLRVEGEAHFGEIEITRNRPTDKI